MYIVFSTQNILLLVFVLFFNGQLRASSVLVVVSVQPYCNVEVDGEKRASRGDARMYRRTHCITNF